MVEWRPLLAQTTSEPTWIPYVVLAQTILMSTAGLIAWLWKGGRWSATIDPTRDILDLKADLTDLCARTDQRFEAIPRDYVHKDLFHAEIRSLQAQIDHFHRRSAPTERI